MPLITDIVQVTISVQSSSIARVGFNSLLILGQTASFTAGWADYEVKRYSTYQQVVADTEIVAGSNVLKMAAAAFAQSPRVPFVYIAKGTAAGIGANVPATDLDQVVINDNSWFGLVMDSANATAIDNAIPWVAANKKYGFFRIQSLLSMPVAQTFYSCIWYETSVNPDLQYVDVGTASRVLSYIPGQVTAAYKTLENCEPTNPSSTDEATLTAAHCNWYPTVGGRNVTYQGWCYNVQQAFIDTYIGALYLEARISEDVWAVLASANKIPYTNNGVNKVVNAVVNRLNTSVEEGYLTNDPAPIVTAPLVSNISPADKSARLLPNIEFQAWTAGAIQTVQINGIIIA